MRPLATLIILATASPAVAGGGRWWEGRSPCAKGTVLKGSAPPRGSEIGCAKTRSGVWHGRRTVWFDACSKAAPCNARKAVKRYHGEYNRGIEHGHWVFWRRDGSRALEGEYYAGKRSGNWKTWDKKGKAGTLKNPVIAVDDTPVESAILAALQSAAASGKEDLALELEEASRDLKRRGGARGVDNASRGRQSGERIGATVSIGPDHLDIPNVDMGTSSFDEGEEEASPYVQEAVRQATRGVVRCYRQARAKRPNLAGEIVARYEIERSGRVTEVRIVESTVTETMNQCVKLAIKETVKLSPHESASAIEVISPWRFEAPKKKSKGRKRK